MTTVEVPGVSIVETVERALPPLATGVPAFLGAVAGRAEKTPVKLTEPDHVDALVGESGGFLGAAVRGFFANGGTFCVVVPVPEGDPQSAVGKALHHLDDVEGIDLVCIPDAADLRSPGYAISPDPEQIGAVQALVLEHCVSRGDRFAILDAAPLPGGTPSQYRGVLEAQRRPLSAQLTPDAPAALYGPWLRPAPGSKLVPPCGHVAGVYAATDTAVGVHTAPANRALARALDLECVLSDADQAELAAGPLPLNCLRALPGRGIRAWGATTLAGEPVTTRRLLITLRRWLVYRLAGLSFEPDGPELRRRIERVVAPHLEELQRAGALAGSKPEDGFYVAPGETSADGAVVTEIGVAPTVPTEFVRVQVVERSGDVSVAFPGSQA